MKQLLLDKQNPHLPSAHLRWADLAAPATAEGRPVRVFLHGLGASSTHDYPEIATHPALTTPALARRSLLVDLLGFGHSDRPEAPGGSEADDAFGYSLEEHAAAVAAVLDSEGLRGAEVFGHSLGGAVALTLADTRPDLVGSLVLGEANLRAGGGAWSAKVAEWREEEFVRHGMAEFLDGESDPAYRTTLRLSSPRALHRTAVGLVRGTSPQLAVLLSRFEGPKAFLVGEASRPYDEEEDAVGAGARVLTVPRSGHPMPNDNPDGLARTLAEAFTP
ncbi:MULTISPECIES: alpha/beta fold hydrolase [Streptomyces]|uniref:Alpha/beta hydrolase n=1 Tax=Streptomyces cacaoi TaxID=1898 RepID=A0A4Y3QWN2_STRCI|nr:MULTISPECIES: alpha/beta hydrolase [Streptomyces]GEB49632.1 alpha/beta hydrolase [Streptomyces cacaoi]